MNLPSLKDGVSIPEESIESLIGSSLLLLPETKVALLQYIQNQGNSEEISRITHFLQQEKIFIVEFMKRRLKEDTFPDKIPLLLGEMRAKFLQNIHMYEV